MPNKRTFQIPVIKKLIKSEIKPGDIIIEPFPFNSKIDAYDYLLTLSDSSVDIVLLDPPYSGRQVKEHYNQKNIKVESWHTSSHFMGRIRKQVARILKPGGKVLRFGWNSGRIYKGFEIQRILLLCHGSEHNDTIVTVQKKMQGLLNWEK